MIRTLRHGARRHGLWAERLASLWLRLHLYSILTTNHVFHRGTGIGEVDIIARRGRVIAFVEVKFRPTLAEAAAAIGLDQRRRIAKAARNFLSGRPDLAAYTIRFDALLLAPWRFPRHVPDAWRIGS